MFNRRRVMFSASAINQLCDMDRTAVIDGCIRIDVVGDKVIARYIAEDYAVRAARFLMNKDVPYVQRG